MLEETYLKFKKNILSKMKKTEPDFQEPVVEYCEPVYHNKGSPPKKGGGSSFTVTKLPLSLEPKGQRPLSLPHFP